MNERVIFRNTVLGVAFGVLIAAGSTMLSVLHQGLPLNWSSAIERQLREPLLWILDFTPLFWGVLAYLSGKRVSGLSGVNRELAHRQQESDRLLKELETLKTGLEETTQVQVFQLHAVAEIARELVAIHDLPLLLDRVTNLISGKFGYYHVGIYLLDATGKYALLRATNSEGGQYMLARGHKFEVGQEGIVGYVAAKGTPRIVLDDGEDGINFNTADLPGARSEMALPLKIQERVTGVLDIQSKEEGAFSPQDEQVMQILADLVALAIENVRLIDESNRAYQELEIAYGRRIQETWSRYVEEQPTAFSYSLTGVEPVPAEALDQFRKGYTRYDPEATGPGSRKLVVPMSLRQNVIGTLVLKRSDGETPWSMEDQLLLERAAAQVAHALESARLLEEVQNRMQQESLISRVSSRLQGSLNLETVMKTAVQEIGLAMDATRVQLHLEADNASNDEEILGSPSGYSRS